MSTESPLDAFLEQAEALAQAGNFESARSVLEAALEQAPDNPKVALMRAEILATLGEENELRKVVEAFPHSYEIRMVLVNMLIQQKRFEEAGIEIDVLVGPDFVEEIHKKKPTFYVALGQIQFELNDFKAAQSFLAWAINLIEHLAGEGAVGPENAPVYQLLARTEMLMGNLERALELCDSAIKLKPDDPSILSIKTEVLSRMYN